MVTGEFPALADVITTLFVYVPGPMSARTDGFSPTLRPNGVVPLLWFKVRKFCAPETGTMLTLKFNCVLEFELVNVTVWLFGVPFPGWNANVSCAGVALKIGLVLICKVTGIFTVVPADVI